MALLFLMIICSGSIALAATDTLWENGEWDGVDGLASELNTEISDARAADDFSLDGEACSLYRIERIRGQLLQSSSPPEAIIEIYADSGGGGPVNAASLFCFPGIYIHGNR